MLKTFLILSAAASLAAPCAQAQSHHVSAAAVGHGSYGRADYRGHYAGRGGRYFYFGGVPYFYPFFDVGFGYPGYAYDAGYGFYGDSYAGGPDGGPYGGGYGDAPYQGKITNQPGGGQNGPSLPAVVQQQLAKRGYYKGEVDGKFGPASRSALSRFQEKNGLEATGRIDQPTLMALGFSDHA